MTLKAASNNLFTLPRWQKRLIMLGVDVILLLTAVWLSFALRLGSWQPELNDGIWLLIVVPWVTLPVFVAIGLYRAVIRFMGGQALVAVMQGVTLSAIMLGMLAFAFNWEGIPRSIYPIYWGVALLLIGSSRYFIRRYYHTTHRSPECQHIAIYGAGDSGTQLALALEHMPTYRVCAFLDDNTALQNSVIHGIRVYSPQKLEELTAAKGITQILLAMPSLEHQRRREIIEQLESSAVHVRTIPQLAELVSGQHAITELREIAIDDLLGRMPVAPDADLLHKCITGKAVMVTGAGGSIGSELCRQIIRLQPSVLVLFDSSEFALYQIEQELISLCKHEKLDAPLVAMLGSVQNYQRVDEILHRYRIDTLYHAAAYKHVPMVEHNPIEGLRNNVFGTLNTAKAARAAGVRHFILISTDKAVRPTNIMGASKRMAELVLQGLAQMPGDTTFSMVRFGNVLGSSGSVVPLFRKQIQAGGPLTVTHPDIIRYFMTIPEAAQLVIQAGAMARGGEVFVLDMGEPVKILDLAKRMIHLSGLRVRDESTPEGDIAIQFTGLRPGEKLYEELLIGDAPQQTHHARIFMAHEDALGWMEMAQVLEQLETICQQRNLPAISRLLKKYIHGFKHQGFQALQNETDISTNGKIIPLSAA